LSRNATFVSSAAANAKTKLAIITFILHKQIAVMASVCHDMPERSTVMRGGTGGAPADGLPPHHGHGKSGRIRRVVFRRSWCWPLGRAS
jgi:hypothetical protein